MSVDLTRNGSNVFATFAIETMHRSSWQYEGAPSGSNLLIDYSVSNNRLIQLPDDSLRCIARTPAEVFGKVIVRPFIDSSFHFSSKALVILQKGFAFLDNAVTKICNFPPLVGAASLQEENSLTTTDSSTSTSLSLIPPPTFSQYIAALSPDEKIEISQDQNISENYSRFFEISSQLSRFIVSKREEYGSTNKEIIKHCEILKLAELNFQDELMACMDKTNQWFFSKTNMFLEVRFPNYSIEEKITKQNWSFINIQAQGNESLSLKLDSEKIEISKQYLKDPAEEAVQLFWENIFEKLEIYNSPTKLAFNEFKQFFREEDMDKLNQTAARLKDEITTKLLEIETNAVHVLDQKCEETEKKIIHIIQDICRKYEETTEDIFKLLPEGEDNCTNWEIISKSFWGGRLFSFHLIPKNSAIPVRDLNKLGDSDLSTGGLSEDKKFFVENLSNDSVFTEQMKKYIFAAGIGGILVFVFWYLRKPNNKGDVEALAIIIRDYFDTQEAQVITVDTLNEILKDPQQRSVFVGELDSLLKDDLYKEKVQKNFETPLTGLVVVTLLQRMLQNHKSRSEMNEWLQHWS